MGTVARCASVLAFGLVTLVSPRAALGDWTDEIGLTQLQMELGGSVPTGAGVTVSMGEAPAGAAYMPNTASANFSGKTFVDGTGTNVGVNGHANGVADIFFGNTTSAAPGVAHITVYDGNDWLNNKLGYESGTNPASQPFKVQNHSWIENASSDAQAENLAKRVDYVVNRDDVLVIGGSTNGGDIPKLLAHSYNAISVGRSDGGHGAGTTSFYGTGRQRPDIVAPASTTSAATPMVSSAAAMLYEYASGTGADHVETMRATLMAGAAKSELPTWDRTATRPIDEVYGVGELNVYNSFKILQGGEYDGALGAPASPVGLFGYDFVTASDFTGPLSYQFVVDGGKVMNELSIFLSWNIDVGDSDMTEEGFSPFVDLSPGASLANLNLSFFDSSDALIDQSISEIDNFEHIYYKGLASGTYTLQVSGDRAVDYGLAWRSSVTAVPEPPSLVVLSLVCMGIACGRKRRKSLIMHFANRRR